MLDNFEFVIASPIDRDELICEIYYKGEIFAEISQDNKNLLIQLYSPQNQKYWEFPLLQFQNIIEEAKKHLLGDK